MTSMIEVSLDMQTVNLFLIHHVSDLPHAHFFNLNIVQGLGPTLGLQALRQTKL